MCKSCRTTKANQSPNRNVKRENNPAWKGYKEIPYGWFSNYFERKSKRKQKIGNITIQQVHELWEKQDRKCALSGVDIGFASSGTRHTCSIDRIDSSKGYIKGNVVIVSLRANILKNDATPEELEALSRFYNNI